MASTQQQRLQESCENQVPWKKWGTYLSERQSGTVREDYSNDGDAWAYCSHDLSQSRAYRCGEDGLAGICDDRQLLCFALALWNGKDPVLKERQFGPHGDAFGEAFNRQFDARKAEADAFYQERIPGNFGEDEGLIVRQALAGMLWTKQYYEYDVTTCLKEQNQEGLSFRNEAWTRMVNRDVISMPDKWEYPWYATWDLAFHTVALILVDDEFAKQQLMLFLEGRYLHPDGQLPAYEWDFGDVNPPVHPFAVYAVYLIDMERRGDAGDHDFLRRAFDRLVLNFNCTEARRSFKRTGTGATTSFFTNTFTPTTVRGLAPVTRRAGPA